MTETEPGSGLAGMRTDRLALTPDEWFLRFWGVRGSIPAPGPETIRYGGNTACVELRLAMKCLFLMPEAACAALARA